MSDATLNLRGHFLISMPHMTDPYFAQSLIYICNHDAEGAMGLVVNRTSPLNLRELLAHLKMPEPTSELDDPVYYGGPVHSERGFVLHPTNTQRWHDTEAVDAAVSLTSSLDILDAIARGLGPEDKCVTLGYAGWSGGQLEDEIRDNAWLSCPANSDILFRTPVEERLSAAAALLGIDLDLLTADTGHA